MNRAVDINRTVILSLFIALLLLSYLIVNFQPPIIEGQIDLNLSVLPNDQPPLEVDPQDQADVYQLTAHSAGGPIDLLTITIRISRPNRSSMGICCPN